MDKEGMSPWIFSPGISVITNLQRNIEILKCLSELGQTSSWDQYDTSNLLSLSTNFGIL